VRQVDVCRLDRPGQPVPTGNRLAAKSIRHVQAAPSTRMGAVRTRCAATTTDALGGFSVAEDAVLASCQHIKA
jgi:hypothetical protein